MSEFAFYMDVLRALEAVGAAYMVVGAFGASAYGLSRATHDADIIVNLDDAACDALAECFPPPRYYADPQQMRDSIRLGIMFNIIDGSLGVKADLLPLSREPAYLEAFRQRVRCVVVDPQGREVVLDFVLSGFSDNPFDVDYVTSRAAQIGTDALALWHSLLERTQRRSAGAAPLF